MHKSLKEQLEQLAKARRETNKRPAEAKSATRAAVPAAAAPLQRAAPGPKQAVQTGRRAVTPNLGATAGTDCTRSQGRFGCSDACTADDRVFCGRDAERFCSSPHVSSRTPQGTARATAGCASDGGIRSAGDQYRARFRH